MPICFGSDSPVTPLRPWSSVRACLQHTNPAEQISARAAFLGSEPLLARFGLHNLEGQKQFSSPAQVDELGRVYGLGLQFAPSERVDLRAEVQRRTRVGSDGSSDASAMLFTAQVRF